MTASDAASTSAVERQAHSGIQTLRASHGGYSTYTSTLSRSGSSK